MRPYHRRLKLPSRRLRRQQTDAEWLLWSRLRRKQLAGVQFYRQRPLGPYIVDFYAPAANLVIEVDGAQHHAPEQRGQDAARDRYLQAADLRVLRFANRQVLVETDAVVETIRRAVAEAKR